MKRKTFNKIRRYFFLILIGLVIAGFFYFIFWFVTSNVSRINQVNVSGANPEIKNTELIPKVTKLITSSKRLFFLPADHIMTYHKDEVTDLINKELPNVESVSVKTAGLHTLNIEITSRTPSFNLTTGKVLDKHGVIYSELSSTSTLPFLNSSSTPSEDEIKTMADFMKRVTTRLFDVSAVEITKDNDIYFFDKTHSVTLKYHKGDDTNILWNTFISALDTPPLSTVLQDKKSALEYVDLRFGNKVFYKFKTEDKNQVVPNTAISTYANTNQTSSQGILAKPNR